MKYMTMICDIKNSRHLQNRENVQYLLIEMLKEANTKFSNLIVNPFIITIGDEWQGLLKYPCDYSILIEHFHKILGSIDFYCGIGIGEIAIHNFELTVNQLDGPSFYLARSAIKTAKKYSYSLVLIQ